MRLSVACECCWFCSSKSCEVVLKCSGRPRTGVVHMLAEAHTSTSPFCVATYEMRIEGIATTASFHKQVLQHAEFAEGRVDTSFVERVFLS